LPTPLKNSDLTAGITAIAALALALLAHLPFWVGLLVAVLIYAGVVLLLRRPVAAVPAIPSLPEQIAALEGAGRAGRFPKIQRQLYDITTQARAIAAYFGQHPGTAGQWEEYLRECLSTALTGTRQFTELAPHLSGPEDPAAVKFGDFLQTLAETLKGVYGQLIAADAADFSASMDAYKSTLHEINQIYLGGGKP